MGGCSVSGFSPDWLALREPADAAARDRTVLAACRDAFMTRESISVCDLGSGTGAAVRAFSNLLPVRQHWTLVDNDADNLAAAKTALAVWADSAASEGDTLRLRHGTREIHIRTHVHDFANDAACWPAETDLVTATALFDLTSAPWIARFVAALAARRTPLLSTLTTDGILTATPTHALDEKIAASFRSHQSRDKGFGPAAGADAARVLEDTLRDAGYRLTIGDSPWQLRASDGPLLTATVDGILQAVGETGAIATADLAAWNKDARVQKMTVGHRDVFAHIAQ